MDNKERKKFNIIGKISEEDKKKIEDDLNERFFKNRRFIFDYLDYEYLKQFLKNEFPKTEEEIKIIELANKLTSDLIRQFKIEPNDIPIENVHIVSNILFNKIESESKEERSAITFPTFQNIVIDKNKYKFPLKFFFIVCHEFLHLKSYSSFFAFKENEKLDFVLSRIGINIFNVGGKNFFHNHFKGLYEAIIEETVKKIFYENNVSEHPIFKEYKEKISSIENFEEKRQYIAKIFNIDPSDIYFLEKKGDKIIFNSFSYSLSRKFLNYLIDKIFEEFKDKYKDKKDIFNEFLKAVFKGNILNIARLVEKTFGKGSFRILGNMIGEEDAINYLETFKELRRLKLAKERN